MENIEKMIYEETEKRLHIMEQPEYVFPKQVSKADIAGIVAMVGVSLVLIVLCMTGVII